MGLACTHDAFEGAYSAFNSLRTAICYAAGGLWPYDDNPERLKELEITDRKPGWWYVPDAITRETHPGLYVFLEHEDCNGEISPEDCVKVADDLERLLPEIEKRTVSHGHIERDGGYAAVTRKFIAGCRLAASRNESLEFH